jgi:putative ubiquitin-RnfH superfamily antitoxin RatB of RatAB toxin-antitoxin module
MASIRIEVVLAHPRRADVRMVTLPAGATARDALRAAGVAMLPGWKLGLFGRLVAESHGLADGDRVEVYRPLEADPKEARRRRAKRAR